MDKSGEHQCFRRKQASEYIERAYNAPCKPNTLAKMAVTGGGPEFQLFGRFPLYSKEALDNWAKSRLSGPVSSTSEYCRPNVQHAA